VVTTAHLYVSN